MQADAKSSTTVPRNTRPARAAALPTRRMNRAGEVDRTTERHGRAAVMALWHDLKAINDPDWTWQTIRKSQALVHRYLVAYTHATPEAQCGFAQHAGSMLSFVAGPHEIDPSQWAGGNCMRGRALNDDEREKHKLAWLNGSHGGRV